jgi:hypothetical protein
MPPKAEEYSDHSQLSDGPPMPATGDLDRLLKRDFGKSFKASELARMQTLGWKDACDPQRR